MILNHLIEYVQAMLVKTHNIGEHQQRLKKHFVQVFFGLLIVSTSYAQTNLVPNYSFETYTICPELANGFPPPPPWVEYSYNNLTGYRNSCNIDGFYGVPFSTGNMCYQYPKTGNGNMVFLYYTDVGDREYLQVKLNKMLKLGKKYYGKYYVNNVDIAGFGCNNIGMLFTNNVVQPNINTTLLQANPQILNYGNPVIIDTQYWVKVSGIFTAHGGEQYLTLGNFKPDSNTKIQAYLPNPFWADYNVDDVSVYELDSFCLNADAGSDTTINAGDSVFIGSYTNGIDTIKWYNSSGQVIDSVRPGFWVKHNTTGTYMYIVEQTVNGCYSRDTVYVNVVLPLVMINYKLLMINEKQVVNEWATANEVNVHHYNIERSTNGKDFEKVGTVKANNKSYNEYNFTDLLTTHYSLPTTLYYRITGVDNDGRKTFSQIKNVELSIKNNGINVFPNPAKDVVNISSKEKIKEVRVFDMFGREIATGTNLRNDGTNHLSLNINHYPKGLYIVQISSINKIENIKLVVE